MNADELKLVESGSPDEIDQLLSQFTAKNNGTFLFSGFDASSRKHLGAVLAKKLSDDKYAIAYPSMLEFLRILARDKKGLEDLANDDLYRILSVRARLTKDLQGLFPQEDVQLRVTTEAQKVLCNLVFQSTSAQRHFSREEIVDVLMARISANKESSKWPLENQLLDMKLLFIVSILCADTRAHFRNNLHAVQDLCVTATMLGAEAKGARSRNGGGQDKPVVNGIVCEILKVLFNLVYNMPSNNLSLGEEMDFVNLGTTSRELLLAQPSEEVKKHIINLLTVVKEFGYNQLAPPMDIDTTLSSSTSSVPFDGFDLYAMDVVLKYLDDKLTKAPSVGKNSDESLAPVLCALTEAARVVPVIRRYLKQQVLPPLKDVLTRPEIGSTLRNKICRLLTSPNTAVRDSAGDFLYILCKNNVQRLIKYTGYGNAAGWLAEKGLMGLPKNDGAQMDDSEDTDTEEWKEYRDSIDPMTGMKEERGPDPMAGMTEEQKEHEANKLANVLHRLLDSSTIRPAAIGPDGRPVPMENVLQFRDEILKQRPKEEKHSDDEE